MKMIMMPPEDLQFYISVDENGDWIHAPNMPAELEEKFLQFVKEEKAFREQRQKK